MKLRPKHAGTQRDSICFGHAEPPPERPRLAYRLSLGDWNGQQRAQMAAVDAA